MSKDEAAAEDPRSEAWEAARAGQAIRIRGGELNLQADALEQLLVKYPDAGIYQRAGQLVEIGIIADRNESAIRRPAGAMVIMPVSVTRVREVATTLSLWERYDRRSNDWRRIDCPREVADTLCARGRWDVPVLRAVIHAPTVDDRGEFISDPGFHYETGLYLDALSNWPQLKLKPDQGDAAAALEVMRDAVSEFPFSGPGAESVWMAAVMTALIRPFLPTAPLFGFDAPVMASGKTLLAELVGIIAGGRPPSMMSDPRDEQELEKGLLAALIAGDSLLVIDNITSTYNSNLLCAVATSPSYTGRILGQTKQIKVSTAVTIIATGNNLAVRGDLATRFLFSRLDPGMEHPEERTFKRTDIRAYVSEHRTTIVNAALTIMRAYSLAGRPDIKTQPFGRFEVWDQRVRRPLVWAGAADPCETRQRVEASDPDREQLGELLTAWWGNYGGQEILVRQMAHDVSSGGEDLAALRDALHAIAADGSRLNMRRLGKRISSWEGRVVDGMRIMRGGKVHQARAWKVENMRSGSFDSLGSFSTPNAGKSQRNIRSKTKQTPGTPQTPRANTMPPTVMRALQQACKGLALTPAQFAGNLSDQDLQDIEAGHMTAKDLRAWAEHFDQGNKDG